MMIRKISKLILVIFIGFQNLLTADEMQFKGDLNSSMTIIDDKEFDYTSVFENTRQFFKGEATLIDGLTFFTNNVGMKWLVLRSNDLCFIYSSEDNRPFFWGVNPLKVHSTEMIVFSFSWKGSSYLHEKNNQYLPGNLGKTQLEMPWVEGVDGFGKGELISFQKPILSKRIYLSNGFVSYKKPYLYKSNNRVKTIKITDLLDPEFILTVELKDTPDPQRIELGEEKVRQLQFEIRDVYKGEKWDDTCINFILVEL